MPNILVHGHMRYDTSEEDKLKEHIQQVELELSKLRNDLEILQLRENDLENNNKILKRAVRHMKKEDNKIIAAATDHTMKMIPSQESKRCADDSNSE